MEDGVSLIMVAVVKRPSAKCSRKEANTPERWVTLDHQAGCSSRGLNEDDGPHWRGIGCPVLKRCIVLSRCYTAVLVGDGSDSITALPVYCCLFCLLCFVFRHMAPCRSRSTQNYYERIYGRWSVARQSSPGRLAQP